MGSFPDQEPAFTGSDLRRRQRHQADGTQHQQGDNQRRHNHLPVDKGPVDEGQRHDQVVVYVPDQPGDTQKQSAATPPGSKDQLGEPLDEQRAAARYTGQCSKASEGAPWATQLM